MDLRSDYSGIMPLTQGKLMGIRRKNTFQIGAGWILEFQDILKIT